MPTTQSSLSDAHACLSNAALARNADTYRGDRDAASLALGVMACGYALYAIAEILSNAATRARNGGAE